MPPQARRPSASAAGAPPARPIQVAPISRQRRQHPVHRPPRSEASPVKVARRSEARRRAHDQPHAGAGVAAVDDVGGLGEAAAAGRPASGRRPAARRSAPKAAHGRGGAPARRRPPAGPRSRSRPAPARRGSARGARSTCRRARARGPRSGPPRRAVSQGRRHGVTRSLLKALRLPRRDWLLTARPVAWQGSRRSPHPRSLKGRRLGQSRTGRQTNLPQLPGEILRPEPAPGRTARSAAPSSTPKRLLRNRRVRARAVARLRADEAEKPGPVAAEADELEEEEERTPEIDEAVDEPAAGRRRRRRRRRARRAAAPADDLGVDFAEDEDIAEDDDDDVPFLEDEDETTSPTTRSKACPTRATTTDSRPQHAGTTARSGAPRRA